MIPGGASIGHMADPTGISVEHFLHSGEWENAVEYVEGAIEERHAGAR